MKRRASTFRAAFRDAALRVLATLSATALIAAATPTKAAAHEPATERAAPAGHPVVKLDLLDLSPAPAAAPEEDYVRSVLVREARHADWGAGRGAHIEFRVRIDELSVTEEPGVLRVRCSATGWLPRGRVAKSHLAFGGAPKDREALVHHVLEIVSRGVISRLADLERKRRGR